MNPHFRDMRQSLDRTGFWRTAAILILIFALAERMWLVKALKTRPFVVASSPSGYHVPIVEELGRADEMHHRQAELVLQTLLNRGQSGVDSPERLRLLCTQEGFRRVGEHLREENPEFTAKSLSQKVEIARVKLLTTSDRKVMVRAEGQLLRMGIFEGGPFQEVLPFTAELVLVFNRDLLVNNKYPTLLHHYKIQTPPTSK